MKITSQNALFIHGAFSLICLNEGAISLMKSTSGTLTLVNLETKKKFKRPAVSMLEDQGLYSELSSNSSW